MEIKTILVVGAGQLGRGIAQVGVQSGFNVIMTDVKEDLLKNGASFIEAQLRKMVASGKIGEEDCSKALKLLTSTTNLSAAKDADIVIEAAPESLSIKAGIFAGLEKVCPERTVFASNTSSIPITRIASAGGRPDRVIGMHFMNPVPVIKELEIIRGYLTSDVTFDVVLKLGKAMGRNPIKVSRDFAQFADTEKTVRQVEGPGIWRMVHELLWRVVEGKITIDEAAAQNMPTKGAPMPLLRFLDLIGLDTCLNVQTTSYEEYCQPYLYPHPLLKRLVEAGHLGKKSGIGFFDYSEAQPKVSPFLRKFLVQNHI